MITISGCRRIQREAKADPRGLHLNLFSGGLPKAPAVKSAPRTVAQRVDQLSTRFDFPPAAGKILSIVVEHYERVGTPLMDTSFDIARKASLSLDDTRTALNQLTINGLVRCRCDNVLGVEGFVPGDNWARLQSQP